MAQTNSQLPTTVIPNSTVGTDWLSPNNILLADGEFAVSGGTSQILTVGNFPINLVQGDSVGNIVFAVKGYRGSFNTTLQVFAVDDTSGVAISYPLLPTFQGFDGTNTLYTFSPTLFATTWTINQINNIKIKLIADGELHLDYVTLNIIYTPAATQTIFYDTLTGTFDVGDVITGTDSGATATVVSDDGVGQMNVNNVNGVFVVGETITGVPSGATAVITTNTTSGQEVVDEFVQAQPFQLAQSMTSTDLFCFVKSFNYPDGSPISIADFHGDAMLVIEQGIPNQEENVMITDVEHNYNGLNVVRLSFTTLNNRGLQFHYPYTADSTLRRDHDGTSEMVISNNAPFYSRFLKTGQIDALVSAPIEVDDESTSLTTSLHKINFLGAGVTAVLNGAHNVDVTIPGGSGGQASIQFQDEGTNLGTSGTVITANFTGSGVTASRAGNILTVNVPGGGGGGSVDSVTSSDIFIDVDNTDPANPILSLDVTDLANDTTFINELTSNTTFQTNVNNFVNSGQNTNNVTAFDDFISQQFESTSGAHSFQYTTYFTGSQDNNPTRASELDHPGIWSVTNDDFTGFTASNSNGSFFLGNDFDYKTLIRLTYNNLDGRQIDFAIEASGQQIEIRVDLNSTANFIYNVVDSIGGTGSIDSGVPVPASGTWFALRVQSVGGVFTISQDANTIYTASKVFTLGVTSVNYQANDGGAGAMTLDVDYASLNYQLAR